MKRIEIVAVRRWQLLFLVIVPVFCLSSCQQPVIQKEGGTPKLSDKQVAVLNGLRDEINLTYGYVDGWPRIDRGPCGRFAKLFYEHWNNRFHPKVTITFIMTTNGICDHVLIKLPDESYYDGGNGVISGATLLREFRNGDRIEEMVRYDFSLLDQRSYSLKRSYELCTNYSDEVTASIIDKHLTLLPRN